MTLHIGLAEDPFVELLPERGQLLFVHDVDQVLQGAAQNAHGVLQLPDGGLRLTELLDPQAQVGSPLLCLFIRSGYCEPRVILHKAYHPFHS